MELTQENVEKLNVAKMPDALLCKGLLLDAIEAGDALEKELSNLRQDYRKISELYIAEQNKCGHLESRIKELESIPHTDNTSVIDALQKRVKELEANAELDQKKRLMLCKGYNQKCERVKELEATVSKMETTQKWISVKDRLPTSDTTQYLVYDAVTKEYEKSFFSVILKCFQYDVTHWQPLPPPPTTEESSAIEKEN